MLDLKSVKKAEVEVWYFSCYFLLPVIYLHCLIVDFCKLNTHGGLEMWFTGRALTLLHKAQGLIPSTAKKERKKGR